MSAAIDDERRSRTGLSASINATQIAAHTMTAKAGTAINSRGTNETMTAPSRIAVQPPCPLDFTT